MSDIVLERGLEIVERNKVRVPGCEPSSTVSSPTLFVEQRKLGLCKSSLVDLQAVLDAIPGCRVEFTDNFGVQRQKMLFLPPFDPSVCPCEVATDWYGVIRALGSDDTEVQTSYDSCNVIGMGQCPSPDFRTIAEPDPDPYFAEGDDSFLNHYTP